eukprot:GDKH01022617.1.p1 GENE.GDKH01022617.1~~GDKH01022617.1.p1  ORF type:complete len:50 (-),score=3.17 GDKH01022617.1:27-176(-)
MEAEIYILLLFDTFKLVHTQLFKGHDAVLSSELESVQAGTYVYKYIMMA